MALHDPDVKDCTKPGLMCETCSTTVMCVEINGNYTKTGRMSCPDGYSCFNGTCTKDTNPFCDYVNMDFPCQYKGNYPHPGDWSKYVVCIPNDDGSSFQAFTVDCEPDTGYNALTTYCSKNLSSIDPASFPVDRCLQPSMTPSVLSDNPSIYYVCGPYGDSNKLYPYQYTCPSGGTFDNGACTTHLT
ncbi:hypothetical protein HHI36_015554 [Cryptolaemus montrouzieri]|uniref:Uncharacterized protein n=1 Tax=Cryptolaemus montrouzieri TaxID=559131 RepID=A0ABD2N5Y8_9CUCU